MERERRGGRENRREGEWNLWVFASLALGHWFYGGIDTPGVRVVARVRGPIVSPIVRCIIKYNRVFCTAAVVINCHFPFRCVESRLTFDKYLSHRLSSSEMWYHCH